MFESRQHLLTTVILLAFALVVMSLAGKMVYEGFVQRDCVRALDVNSPYYEPFPERLPSGCLHDIGK